MNALTENHALPESSLTRPYSRWFDVAPALGISLMDHLFNRLDGAYPHKWRSNFANQQAIDNWAESWVEAFEEERITPDDVKAGLRECRKRFTWPPSCAEFITACRPSLDTLIAYHEAVAGMTARGKGEMGEWSHPAIYWAASSMRADLMNCTHAQIKAKWEVALGGQMKMGAWADIPPARVLLPPPDISPAARKHAERMLAALQAGGITKDVDSKGVDHKRWARLIMERVANKDKTLSMIQIQFAKMAFNIDDKAAA